MAAYRRVNDLGHLQADCLYTGISSGPNARCRVWEAFTFTFYLTLMLRVTVWVSVTEGTYLIFPSSDSSVWWFGIVVTSLALVTSTKL